MMISTRGRYALRVMIELARQEGYVALKDVARRQDISEKYLEAIMKKLVGKGLVSGVRGKGGGYRLAKPAEECTVGEILRATENCPTLPMWQELNGLIQDYFDRTTLAHLAEKARQLEGEG